LSFWFALKFDKVQELRRRAEEQFFMQHLGESGNVYGPIRNARSGSEIRQLGNCLKKHRFSA